MIKYYSYFIIILLLGLFSCKSDKIKAKDSTHNVSAAEAMNPNTLPSIDIKEVQYLVDNCTYIDYVWNDLPFSVSQGEKDAILSNISFISTETMTETPKRCKSIGRKSFQVGGDFYLEADIYYGEGCNYYVFYKNNKPIYLNKISPTGITFYQNLFMQAAAGRENLIKQQQGG
jgi:hypothetical protein